MRWCEATRNSPTSYHDSIGSRSTETCL